MKPLCLIVGFGTGVGLGAARAFGKAGFQLGLISRNPTKYTDAIEDLEASGIEVSIEAADVSNESALVSGIAKIQHARGNTTVLIYNAVSPNYGKPTTITASQLAQDFAINVVGALVAAKAVLPQMQVAGGSILFTGGGWAHYPWDGAASIAIGKAGLRSLTLTLAQELAGTNIRVGMVSIMGQVAPNTPFDPDRIGDAFLALHCQSADGYETEKLLTA